MIFEHLVFLLQMIGILWSILLLPRIYFELTIGDSSHVYKGLFQLLLVYTVIHMINSSLAYLFLNLQGIMKAPGIILNGLNSLLTPILYYYLLPRFLFHIINRDVIRPALLIAITCVQTGLFAVLRLGSGIFDNEPWRMFEKMLTALWFPGFHILFLTGLILIAAKSIKRFKNRFLKKSLIMLLIVLGFDLINPLIQLICTGLKITIDPELQAFRYLINAALFISVIGFIHLSMIKPGKGRQALKSLSPREKEVLTWVLKGQSNKEIAQTMSISVSTVKTHTSRIFRKYDVASRWELLARYKDQALSGRDS